MVAIDGNGFAIVGGITWNPDATNSTFSLDNSTIEVYRDGVFTTDKQLLPPLATKY